MFDYVYATELSGTVRRLLDLYCREGDYICQVVDTLAFSHAYPLFLFSGALLLIVWLITMHPRLAVWKTYFRALAIGLTLSFVPSYGFIIEGWPFLLMGSCFTPAAYFTLAFFTAVAFVVLEVRAARRNRKLVEMEKV